MLKKNTQYLYDFDSVKEQVLHLATPIMDVELLGLAKLSGRVLAEDVFAPVDLPSLAISAMDGFGVSTQGRHESLEVTSHLHAGEIGQIVPAGECVKIMTGAPIPAGIDAVIPIEKAFVQTRECREYLLNPQTAKALQNIKGVGSDIQKGEKLLSAGCAMGAREIAVLASVGIHTAAVKRVSRVAVVISGDELREPGDSIEPGEVFDSNSWMVNELLASLSVEIAGVYRLKDDLQVIQTALAEISQRTDLILTIGGASVGDRDHIKSALKSADRFQSWKMNMKPAKPLSIAKLGRATVLALPGNPVAAFMSFQLFAKPFIRKVSGLDLWPIYPNRHKLAQGLTANSDKLLWVQVKETADGLMPMQTMSSSQLLKLAQADGYIRVNPNQDTSSGASVDYWRY